MAQLPCTADPSAKPVSLSGKPGAGGDSALMQQTPTLADEMRAQKGAHVASISLKARSAIMLAGHGGDGIIWLNEALDGWEAYAVNHADGRRGGQSVHRGEFHRRRLRQDVDEDPSRRPVPPS